MTAASPQRERAERGISLRLWVGLLAGPVLWLIQFQVNYALVRWVCGTGRVWVLHSVTIAFLALAAGAAILSWRNWRDGGGRWPRDTEPEPVSRRLFLGVLGMMTSALFALLILAQSLPTFFIDPCAT